MKASELKPGDYFAPLNHPKPSERIIWEYLSPPILGESMPRARVARAGITKTTGAKRLVGQAWRVSDLDDGSFELVPMPGPYVVGKAYRTRGGHRSVYRGRRDNTQFPRHVHKFDFGTTDDEGLFGLREGEKPGAYFMRGPCEYDIMGEWSEEATKLTSRIGLAIKAGDLLPTDWWRTLHDGVPSGDVFRIVGPRFNRHHQCTYHGCTYDVSGDVSHDTDVLIVEDPTKSTCIHGHNQSNTKENTMSKRPLPTVTLDQIFETLKEKGACWYRDLGPMRLAAKLDVLLGGMARGPLDLRILSLTVAEGKITTGDAGWLINNMGPALTPRDLNATGQALGTPAFAKLLDEWENPKPVRRLVKDLPTGTVLAWERGGRVRDGQTFTRVEVPASFVADGLKTDGFYIEKTGSQLLLTRFGKDFAIGDTAGDCTLVLVSEPK